MSYVFLNNFLRAACSSDHFLLDFRRHSFHYVPSKFWHNNHILFNTFLGRVEIHPSLRSQIAVQCTAEC
jgi:hypothetical protein